jgi:hypothetical protein
MTKLKGGSEFGIHIDQILCPLTNTFKNLLVGKSPGVTGRPTDSVN